MKKVVYNGCQEVVRDLTNKRARDGNRKDIRIMTK